MKIWRWLILGTLLFVLWLLLLAPATLFSGFAAKAGLQLQGINGSLWQGQAKAARLQLSAVRGQPLVFDLGEIAWQFQPLALLGLNACAHVSTQLNAQQFVAKVCVSVAGTVSATDLRINIPASYLSLMSPIEASGQVMLAFDNITLSGLNFTELNGTGRVETLNVLMGKDWQNFGNLNLTFMPAVKPAQGFDLKIVSDDEAIQWLANAPAIKLGNKGLEAHITSRLILSQSYQLQWGDGLSMLGFEQRDGAYLIETRLP